MTVILHLRGLIIQNIQQILIQKNPYCVNQYYLMERILNGAY